MKLMKKGRDKPKKEKKPKLTPEQKAQKNKEKVEKQAAAKIKKADDKVKKAEQKVKNKEKAALKKEKDKEKKAANKVKAAEKKAADKQKNRVQKEADKIKKSAEKLQRRAELANRSPMEKKLDQRKKLIKLIAVILALAVVGGGIFFGKQYIPKIVPVFKEKIEKIPFFNKEKDEEKADDKEETEEKKPEEEEMVSEEEAVDDTTLYISGTTVLEAFYSEALKEFLGLGKDELKAQSKAVSNHEAYVNLVNGDDQVIFSSFPTYQEINMAELAAVDLQPIPILNGGFVFFVHKDNPIHNLTLTQLHSIYSGNITNWKDLGGKDEPIIPFQRTDDSGSQIGMYKYVITKNEIMSAREDMKMSETGDVTKVVSESEGGIGYSYYYYMNQLKNSGNIKMIAVNGIKPDDDTIAMAEYPLTTYTYAIVTSEEGTASLDDVLASVSSTIEAINTEGEDAETKTASDEEATSGAAVKAPLSLKMQFVEWILSDEGQALAEKHGFIRHGNR